MNTQKISGLLRQIDQFEKAKYLTDTQKAAAIAQIRRQIDEEAGQGTLDLAQPPGGPDKASSTAAGGVLKGK